MTLRRSHLAVACFIHLYTGVGVIFSFFSLVAISDGSFRRGFLLLFIACVIDLTDGTLARKFRVSEILPMIDGKMLDHIIDYFSNVILPFYIMWQAELLPKPMVFWVALGLLVGAYRFSKKLRIGQDDDSFVGLPSPWVEFSFYAFFLDLSALIMVLSLTLLFILSITSVRFFRQFTYNSFNAVNIILLLSWWSLAFLYITDYISNPFWLYLSVFHPIAYVLMSLVEHWYTRPNAF